jgi:hypothetical protein
MPRKLTALEWLSLWSGVLIGALLLLGGLGGTLWCSNPTGRSVAETIFIAGIVTITVDPFLKKRFIREVGEDIFQHLLGYDLPREMRESFKDFLFTTKTYRRDVSINVHIAAVPTGARVEVKTDATVVASKKTEYQPYFAGEGHEKASLKRRSVTSKRNPKESYSETEILLEPKKDERGVVESKGKKFKLRPGETLDVHYHYVVEKKSEDFYFIFFGSPNIHPVLRLTSDDAIEVEASKPDQRNGNEYRYEKVFLAGDHINIRWWTKEPYPVA